MPVRIDPNCKRCKGSGWEWVSDGFDDVDKDVCRCVIDEEYEKKLEDARDIKQEMDKRDDNNKDSCDSGIDDSLSGDVPRI